jgi:hypothetical protein
LPLWCWFYSFWTQHSITHGEVGWVQYWWYVMPVQRRIPKVNAHIGPFFPFVIWVSFLEWSCEHIGRSSKWVIMLRIQKHPHSIKHLLCSQMGL